MKRGPKPKAFCGKGHRLAGDNLYVSPSGTRHCCICRTLWRRNNQEIIKKLQKAWYVKNLHSYSIKTSIYQKTHPEIRKAKKAKRRAKVLLAGGYFTSAEWKALCKKYHSKCLCCKKKKPLEADHVIPVSKGGSSNISNIQPLCRSCNAKKGTKTIDYRQ
jgi:5-methylcytosine-specific restriction endonuclease McrA